MKIIFTFLLAIAFCSANAQILVTTRYDTSNSAIPDNSIWGMDMASNDVIWLKIFGQGLVSFDGTNWTQYNASTINFPGNNINSFAIDNNNNVFASDWTTVARFNGVGWIDVSPGNVYDGVLARESSSGSIWLADDQGLQEYTGSGWSALIAGPSSPNFSPEDMLVAPNGDIWITSIGSCYVSKYSQASSTWTNYDTNNVSLFPKQWWYSNIAITHDNNILIGGSSNKTLYFDGTSWGDLDTYSGQSMSVMQDVAVKNSVSWIGMCNGFGLASYDGSNWKKYSTNPSYIPITGIRFDTQGYLWMSALDGLYKVATNNLDVNDLIELSDVALLYPSPSDGHITLKFISENFDNAKALVFDISGKQVYSSSLQPAENRIDLTHLPPGVYTLNMRTDNGSYFQKVILY